jgi:hypothetical protein
MLPSRCPAPDINVPQCIDCYSHSSHTVKAKTVAVAGTGVPQLTTPL